MADVARLVGAGRRAGRGGQLRRHRQPERGRPARRAGRCGRMRPGWADREQGRRADAGAVYRVGSISKAVAVTAALRLAERGVLDLDEPVARPVPEIETTVGYRRSAARDHAARPGHPHQRPGPRAAHPPPAGGHGGPLGGDAAGRHPRDPLRPSAGRLLRLLEHRRRHPRPGGAPRDRVCRIPELIAAEICAPLGLTATGFRPPGDRARLATGYERLVDGSISTRNSERQHAGRGFRVPSGGLYSTPSEIAAFAAALGTGAEDVLLSAASRREMLRLATRKSEECSPGPSNGYGVGVELYLDGTEVVAYGHHGDMSGYGAVVLGDPEREVTICVCSNFRGSEELGMESSLDLLRAASGMLPARR